MSNKFEEALGLYKRKCVICGKEFESTSAYVYKFRDKKTSSFRYCCSYKCFRVHEKELENKKRRNVVVR